MKRLLVSFSELFNRLPVRALKVSSILSSVKSDKFFLVDETLAEKYFNPQNITTTNF